MKELIVAILAVMFLVWMFSDICDNVIINQSVSNSMEQYRAFRKAGCYDNNFSSQKCKDMLK